MEENQVIVLAHIMEEEEEVVVVVVVELHLVAEEDRIYHPQVLWLWLLDGIMKMMIESLPVLLLPLHKIFHPVMLPQVVTNITL
jgi:hypothetical protein